MRTTSKVSVLLFLATIWTWCHLRPLEIGAQDSAPPPSLELEQRQGEPNDGVNTVLATVTSVTGRNVFLNTGRSQGVEVGQLVEFNLPDGQAIQLKVAAVSSHFARCVHSGDAGTIEVGTVGRIQVPPGSESEDATPLAPIQAAPMPPHLRSNRSENSPEWTHPPEQWNSDTPLLAPAVSLKRHEREVDLHGMFFGQYLHTWNWKFVDNQYSLGRLGADLWLDNPFGDGGGLRFRGDFDVRGASLFDESDGVDTLGRIDLLSYFNGQYDSRPDRFEIGRFLPSEFPEFGFLDGLEYVRELAPGHRLGLGLGALPEPFPSMQSGTDLQTSVFYSFRTVPDENLLCGIGYQKTWHDGNPDRDLLLTKLSYHPGPRFGANATLWSDIYGNSERLKPSGLEITEVIFNQYFRITPKWGIGTHYVQIRWPELLRREIDPIFDLQILRNRRRSYGAHTWYELLPRVQLNGRLDLWENQDSFEGTTWEAEAVFRQLFNLPLDLSTAVLMTDGLYSSGPGGRIGLATYFPRGMASLNYSVGDYRLTDFADQILHQGITATLDFYNAQGRSLSMYGDYRFGEAQDAASIGIIVRQRFK